MTVDPAIAAALVMVAAGMVLVRIGWGGRRAVAGAGWGLAIAGVILLTWRAGAWGCAAGGATGILVALAAVLHAGWHSPGRPRRPAREAAATAVSIEASDIARRVAVFALVVPGAFAAAQWLAFAAQAFARTRGVGEADRIVLAMLLQPVAWVVIMSVQMTRAGPARMVAPPVVAAVAGAVLWSAS